MNSSRFFDNDANFYSIRLSFICKELINNKLKEKEKRLKPKTKGNNKHVEDNK